jgi:hypothetical protein
MKNNHCLFLFVPSGGRCRLKLSPIVDVPNVLERPNGALLVLKNDVGFGALPVVGDVLEKS